MNEPFSRDTVNLVVGREGCDCRIVLDEYTTLRIKNSQEQLIEDSKYIDFLRRYIEVLKYENEELRDINDQFINMGFLKLLRIVLRNWFGF